jgi:hypothetical protein
MAMAIPAVLVGLQISAWIGFIGSADRQRRADFRAYYYAGEMLHAGRIHDLYASYDAANVTSAFIHPAYESILFVPLSFFPIRIAHALWIVLNLAVVFLIYVALRGDLRHLWALLPWLPLAMLASYLPVNEALMQGQDSLLLALVFSLALSKLRERDSFAAGVCIGFGAFRFQFLVIVIVLFLIWKAWHVLLGFFVSASGALLLSTVLVGVKGEIQYFHLLQRLGDPGQQPVSHMVNVRAILSVLGVSSNSILIAVSLTLLVMVGWLGRNATWNNRLLMALVAGCLLGYHTFLHDLSLLIVPLILACDTAVKQAKYLNLGVLAIVLGLPTFLALFGFPLWLNAFGSGALLASIGFHTRTNLVSQERFIPVGVGS